MGGGEQEGRGRGAPQARASMAEGQGGGHEEAGSRTGSLRACRRPTSHRNVAMSHACSSLMNGYRLMHGTVATTVLWQGTVAACTTYCCIAAYATLLGRVPRLYVTCAAAPMAIAKRMPAFWPMLPLSSKLMLMSTWLPS